MFGSSLEYFLNFLPFSTSLVSVEASSLKLNLIYHLLEPTELLIATEEDSQSKKNAKQKSLRLII